MSTKLYTVSKRQSTAADVSEVQGMFQIKQELYCENARDMKTKVSFQYNIIKQDIKTECEVPESSDSNVLKTFYSIKQELNSELHETDSIKMEDKKNEDQSVTRNDEGTYFISSHFIPQHDVLNQQTKIEDTAEDIELHKYHLQDVLIDDKRDIGHNMGKMKEDITGNFTETVIEDNNKLQMSEESLTSLTSPKQARETQNDSNMTLQNENCNSSICNVKPYICNVCSVGFSKKHHLQVHKRRHTGEKPYKCDVCDIGFAQSSSLKSHKRVHTGEKPYKCDFCGAGFSRSTNLRKHRRTHTGEKPYKCDYCGSGFAEISYLKVHRRKHTREKPYECDICGAKFGHNSSLNSHKRIHTGEKPFKCNFCSAQFSQKEYLKAHRRIHTGEKPYKCDVCGARFAQRVCLKGHKNRHTREKPYTCYVCAATFAYKGSLKSHQRTHTGEKPSKCDVCGAEFPNSSCLKAHKIIHTG